MKEKILHWRGLTSLFTTFGFIIMSITGLMLYITPQGRISYWVSWSFWGLDKTQWGNIHIVSCLLFIIAGGFHIFFNWKPLMRYFFNKLYRLSAGVKLKKELVIALIGCIFIVWAAIAKIPPLSYLLDLNEWAKDAWIISEEYNPPISHAELLSLENFAEKRKIDIGQALDTMKKQGIEVKSVKDSIGKISKENGISPMNLYQHIKDLEPAQKPAAEKSYTPKMVEDEFADTGIGQKTFIQLCQTLEIDLEKAKETLIKNGIQFKETEKFKQIATTNDTDPIEILKMILVKDYP